MPIVQSDVHGHTAGEWRSWDSIQFCLILRAMLFSAEEYYTRQCGWETSINDDIEIEL